MSRLIALIALVFFVVLLHLLGSEPCFAFVATLLVLCLFHGLSLGSIWCLNTLPFLLSRCLLLRGFGIIIIEVDLQKATRA